MEHSEGLKPEICGAVEAMLFAAGSSVAQDKICRVLCITTDELGRYIESINNRYRKIRSGLRIVRQENDYQMMSAPEYNDIVRQLMNIKINKKLSQAALETLAIIAYKQPCTRQTIEQLRGINPISTVNKLLELNLIEESESLPLPGNPVLLKTTPKFLSFLGISSLNQLEELK